MEIQKYRKVKSVHKSLAKQGKFLGTYAPYGYIKSPENKYELIPDRETAPIVKEIFACVPVEKVTEVLQWN